MAAERKYREIVRELAMDQYGYVTTKDAASAGVPAGELPKLAARGGLENVAYGLYRVPDAPTTEFDQFAEALARVGGGAYLHGESVLALWGLADVNPRHIKVAVPRRARPKLPAYIELTLAADDQHTTVYEGLAAQPVADAILECRGRIETERLLGAAKQARADGLLTTAEWQQVRKGLRLPSTVLASADEVHDHCPGRSSSAAKKAEAAFRIAFVRRRSASPASTASPSPIPPT